MEEGIWRKEKTEKQPRRSGRQARGTGKRKKTPTQRREETRGPAMLWISCLSSLHSRSGSIAPDLVSPLACLFPCPSLSHTSQLFDWPSLPRCLSLIAITAPAYPGLWSFWSQGGTRLCCGERHQVPPSTPGRSRNQGPPPCSPTQVSKPRPSASSTSLRSASIWSPLASNTASS